MLVDDVPVHSIAMEMHFNNVSCFLLPAQGPEAGPPAPAPGCDAVGGNMYYNLYTGLGRDFEIKDGQTVRGFAFAQLGGLGNTVAQTLDSWRLSLGAGLAVPFFLGGDFEIAATYPLRTKEPDSLERVQFGIRFSG